VAEALKRGSVEVVVVWGVLILRGHAGIDRLARVRGKMM
jgi:hypothetical protein